MKNYLNHFILTILIFSLSCKEYQIRKTTTSKQSKLKHINLEGRYDAVFDKLVQNEDTLYHLEGFYFETSMKKLPLLLLSRHITDICSDIDINIDSSIRIDEDKLHPRMIPGQVFESINTYENEHQLIVSFNVKGEGFYVSKICDQFYTTYNAGNCNDISQEDTFFVFTSIESSTPLTEREIIDKGLKPLSKKGFEYGTCH